MRMQTGAICASALMFVGCAGDGTGLDENGRPVGEGGAGELAPQFDSIQANVFTPVCTACHSGAAAPLGLRLEEGASFALLVNAPSTEVPGLLRVNPGNPDSSYLIQKLEGTAAVGGRMPLGGSPLPAETIAVIRQWIAEGAQPSSLSPDSMASKPSVLSAAWPMENTSLQQAPVVVVSAQSELDTALLAAGTLTLRRSGGDADFSNGNEAMLAADIRLRSLSPTVFEVRAPEHEWAVDRYELRVSGGAPLALTTLSSLPIDGDADGQAGGDFVLNFQLEERR
jgi:hypothetical protein